MEVTRSRIIWVERQVPQSGKIEAADVANEIARQANQIGPSRNSGAKSWFKFASAHAVRDMEI